MSHDGLSGVLDRLRKAGIEFTLGVTREESITVFAAVPGERWEIDVFRDGQIELEVFRSSGTILDEEALRARILQYAD